ncbi:Polymeric immunoglobulin receptor [Triplophysa tibetana]|nr:Polymeric immunoglobulin receptor [Triplophysa tibetana]
MNILLIFTFFIFSGAVRCFDVIGYSGGSVLVSSWQSWCKDMKYMTKRNPHTNIINNMKHKQWINEGRFSLFCNKNNNLMIYIRDVKTQDSGKYRIGVDDKRFIYMTLTVKEDSCCGASQRVMVNTGQTANFTCQYSQDYKTDYKILFKERKDSIDEVIYTNTWGEKEQLIISDNKDKNQFSVRMTDVRSEDAGVYLCGVRVSYRYSYRYSILTAVHLHIMSKVGVVKASGYSAGGIIFKCRHHQYKSNTKYLIKESDGCCERTYPSVQDQWMDSGDVCLYDDTRAGVLMVYFRELNAGHAGTYRCGVNTSQYTDTFTQVQLDIKDVLSHWWVNKSVSVGDEVNITCRIPEEHKSSPKFFCKEDENHICQTVSRSEVKLNDFSDKSVFTVIISDVTERDAGVYWCGAETSHTDFTFISLTTKVQLKLISKVGVVSVTGYLGGQINFKCHHHQHKSNPKYIIKESDGLLLDQWMDSGDVCLYDDIREGVLMVYFRELNAGHAGTYRCGVNTSHYMEVQLKVQEGEKPHKEITSGLFQNKSVSVGDEVNITCRIPEEHKSSPKIFCKEDENHICETVSRSEVKLNDFSDKSVFTVIISDVTERDVGVYWCGAETSHTDFTFISLTTKVQLKLNMFGDEGGSAQIICPYDPIYKSKTKKLLKSCTDENTLMEMNRWSVNDDKTALVFSVNITGLTAEDAGKYCCAVTLETDVIYLYTHLIIIIKQELLLNKSEGDNMSMECKHHAEYQKVFCKAHEVSMCVNDGVSLQSIRDDGFSLSDETSTGVFTVNISHLREEHSGIYWCGSNIITKLHLEVKRSVFEKIIAGICVTPLLIGALILILYKFIYLKTRGTNGQTAKKQQMKEEESNAACDYENIQDLRPERLASHHAEAVIYSTVGIPTNTPHPNTIYSAVQLPTIPSDDVLYAAVSFHKQEDSLSDATVTFRKSEISTEYATVNRNTRLN